MSKIISIASHKGGVGKSATALNLGVSLASAGHKVLLLDGDPQGCLAMSVDLKKKSKSGLLQVVRKEVNLSDVIVDAKKLPLSMAHLGIEKPFDVFYLTHGTKTGHLGSVKILVHSLAESYDYMLIDTANTIGSFNATLLSCSGAIIVPVTCKSNAVKSLPLLLKLIKQIKQKLNPEITLLGLVLQMLDVNNPYEMETLAIIREAFPRGTFFSTFIPYATQFEKADYKAVPVSFLPDAGELKKAYEKLSREVIQRLEYITQGEEDNEQLEKLF